MTPERWQKVARVYQSALEHDPSSRAAFLADACRDDSALRREVESLLAQEHASVLVDHSVDLAAAAVMPSAPGLTPGAVIGPYRVLALIGEGGMGQVYRAHDKKLQRDVALKILPDAFVHDRDRVARFTREAQVLASLNHPNIGAIYGFEDSGDVHALVLELVEGATLADRIARGPLLHDEALAIARQIAEALEAAHEHGIVHRDLKPANIKVRDDGTVKVLDFGLAKPANVVEADRQVRLTQSPTIMSPAVTGMGVILGTAAYMSPEQAKGKPADKRSDIWAFGCVLYEILTGKRAFDGDDVSDTLAAVLRGEPNWSALPASTPPAVRTLIKGCLERDRRQRIGDVSTLLYVMRSPESRVSAPTSEVTSRRRLVPWIVAAAMAIVAAVALGTRYLQPAATSRSVYRSSILPPANLAGNPSGRLAISPDGRRLAFIAPDAGGRLMLWVRPLDGLTAQPLAGTEDAEHPFWSPDSRYLAFTSGGALKKIEASGGPILTLAQAQSNGYGAWNREDVILFNRAQDATIYRVPAGGGTATPVTLLETSAGETSHRYPFFLPDGRHFLYLAYRAARPVALYVGSIDGSDRIRLMDGESNAVYAQGFLLFLGDNQTLMARPFDTSRLTLTGDAQPVAERVGANPQRGGTFSVSQTGTLVYQTFDSNDTHLGLVSRDGAVRGAVDHRGVRYSDIQVSPDGRQAASVLLSTSLPQADIWVFDFARNAPLRLTTEAAINRSPVWSPDGKRIIFQSNRKNGIFNLYERAGNGAGADAIVLEDSFEKTPWSWSPDGRFLLYSTGPPAQRDLWVLPFEGDRKPFPYLRTPFNESEAEFSPDGKWVAFRSDESGQSELYVAAFPRPSGKWPITTEGGRFPRWGRDGELFFENRSGRELLSVAVSTAPGGVKIGQPRRLFGYFNDGGRKHWDVSPDGQRFLVEVENVENAPAEISPITLVLNWAGGLRQ